MSETGFKPNPQESLKSQFTSDSGWMGLYRASAVLLIATGVVWVAVSWMSRALYVSGYPANPLAYLQLVFQNQALANATWSLWDLADFLLIIPSVGLYLLLRRYNKTLALMGTALQLFFIVYDVSVTELNSLTLVSLSQSYTAAATDSLRAAYLGAATYGYASLSIQTVLSFGIGVVGFLLWCVPMAKSNIFRHRTAIFGGVISIIGIIGSTAPLLSSPGIIGLFQFVTVPIFALWLILVGAQLFRYTRHPAVTALAGQ